jgi:hypothetical protein
VAGAIVYLVALKLLGLDEEERVVLDGIRRRISPGGRKRKHSK